MMRRAILMALTLTILCCGVERKREAPGAAEEAPAAAAGEAPKVGASMPAYAGVRLDGSKFDVAAERGKVTLLNIWATWCGPCRYEIPELEELHLELSPRGFQVVGVTIDAVESLPAVRSFVADQKISYPIVLDPDGRLATMFQTVVIPMSILVDREGTIVWIKSGVVRSDDPKLRAALATAL